MVNIYYFISEDNNRDVCLVVRIVALLDRVRLWGMMESETPPHASPLCEADNPEVSSRRISPDLPRSEGNPSATRSPEYSAPKESNRKSPGLSGAQPDALMNLLEQAAISEAHRTLMGTVVEKISSAESGLHEAFMSLLRGFEVHKVIYIYIYIFFDGTAHARCALCRY